MSPSHDQRFQQLSTLLAEWQALWRPLPFQQRETPWGGCLPGLADTLLALPDDEVQRLQAAPFEASPLAAWLPVDELAALVGLSPGASPASALPDDWGEGIGARKWRQIQAFASRVSVGDHALVEWCAGKGHLGRTLARLHRRPVTGLEWRSALCEAGQGLAERQGLAVRLQSQDVMAPDAGRWLAADVRVAALHACGDLHGRLLTLAAETGTAVSLAPCCYHRTAAADYRALSRRGRALMAEHGLRLSREDLAMAVQETVTAPRGVRRHRARANAWRLGFDLLQREARGRDAYLPVPSLAYGKLPDDFAGFCRWAAEQKGVELPTSVDWAAYEAAGWQRLARVSRLELVRHLFRRPLEVWLALDRVRLLEEAGFRVSLSTFCERALTPRNLLIETH
ncbi:methyltransferase [Halomonas nitroreducens]|uniref:Methyltransferase n=1 Tax=Halomonas nitroreducens TaxID=447425 RepID=A0A3S0KSM4_9GAMM|nr:methyltransferase [Halomonas nitroreducens]RTR05931.1 methyltransferase [Halomonas nitroreducens]